MKEENDEYRKEKNNDEVPISPSSNQPDVDQKQREQEEIERRVKILMGIEKDESNILSAHHLRKAKSFTVSAWKYSTGERKLDEILPGYLADSYSPGAKLMASMKKICSMILDYKQKVDREAISTQQPKKQVQGGAGIDSILSSWFMTPGRSTNSATPASNTNEMTELGQKQEKPEEVKREVDPFTLVEQYNTSESMI